LELETPWNGPSDESPALICAVNPGVSVSIVSVFGETALSVPTTSPTPGFVKL
jgi:hypothetical protein